MSTRFTRRDVTRLAAAATLAASCTTRGADSSDPTLRSQMKHADALILQARHCLPCVVIAVRRLYDRNVVDSRVMHAYGQNRSASDGDK